MSATMRWRTTSDAESFTKARPSIPLSTRSRPSRPLLPLGRSTWVTSPVTTTREPNPMRVEANSINAFRPIRGSNLTAFGFRVYAVLGYEHDDAIFRKGSGEPISDSAYGVVVNGPAETVESRVREAGSRAIVKQVVPLLITAILCDGR